MNGMVVHGPATFQPQSICLLALIAIQGFEIWTPSVLQAVLQTTKPLSRNLFVSKPMLEFNLFPDQFLKLLEPLYDLCGSGDLWPKTLQEHHRMDLGMNSHRLDLAVYKLMVDGLLAGLSDDYVNDLLRTGRPAFRELSRKTHARFEMDEDESIPYTFSDNLASKYLLTDA